MKPWITPGLMRCIRHRDKLHQKCRKNPKDDIQEVVYKRYRNFCNDLLHKLKRQYEQSQLSISMGNSKKLWDTIKSICNLKAQKQESTQLLSFESSDPNTAINSCNSYFANVGQNLANNILLKLNANEEDLASQIHADSLSPLSAWLFFRTPY